MSCLSSHEDIKIVSILGVCYSELVYAIKAWNINSSNSWLVFLLGIGTVENSTVRFGFRFCFYGSVLSRFPKRFINDISWIRNYALECVAELAWTCKFLYTSSLASFSMLRRLLRIVKVAREQEAPLWNGYLIGAFDRHSEASSADSFITPPACIENRTAWRGVRFQTG